MLGLKVVSKFTLGHHPYYILQLRVTRISCQSRNGKIPAQPCVRLRIYIYREKWRPMAIAPTHRLRKTISVGTSR